jgi:hypothetical protein
MLSSCLLLSLPAMTGAAPAASAPAAPALLTPADQALLRDNMPTLSWSAQGASSTELWLDGRLQRKLASGTGCYIPFPLSFGDHDWTVVATDGQGVRTSRSARFRIEDAPLTETPPGALLLREGWCIASALEVGTDGAALSSGSLPEARWCHSSVPVTALGALVRNGIYDNPYVGTNILRIPDSSDTFNTRHDRLRFSHVPGRNPWSKPYWFIRDFTLPATLQGERLWLTLGEINYRAEVWLNGRRLAEATSLAGMEQPFRIPIDAAVRRVGVNHLAIAIHPVESPGEPAPPPTHPLDDPGQNMGQDGMICMNYTRWDTQGWDWQTSVPDRDLGITEDVFISGTGNLELGEPCISPRLSLGGTPSAELLLDLELTNHGKAPAEALLVGRLEDGAGLSREFSLPVRLHAEATTRLHLGPAELAALRLERPRLWWPRELGEPALHSLSLELQAGGSTVSSRRQSFGIRKIDTHLDADGHRVFLVNGRRLFLRGGNWVNDMMLTWNSGRYAQEVALACHAGLNFLRVWGPNGVPPQAFFNAADREGLLVWQDFLHDHWGTFQNKQGYAPELELFLRASTAIVRKLRNHPSLFLWCGGNEGPNPREDWLLGRVLPENDAKDQRPYLRSSNGDGLQGGGPYHNLPPSEYFANRKLRGFNSEVGPSGVPEWESLEKFLDIPSQDWAPGRFPLSAAWALHNATDQPSPTDPRKFSTYDSLLRDSYGMPSGTDAAAMQAYSQRCQLMNFDAYRAALESLNQGLWQGATGFALWKFNASWPGLTWQLSDWYMQPNAGFYAVRRALAPIHVQLDRDTRRLRLVNRGLNETGPLLLEARMLDAKGTLLWAERHELSVPADSSQDSKVEVPSARQLSFLCLSLRDRTGTLLADNLYWLAPGDEFRGLAELPAPDLAAELLQGSAGADFELVLTNHSPFPALLVRAALVSLDSGLECLPSLWSDNYLQLPPGAERRISVRSCGTALPGHPAVRLQAWNLPPRLLQPKDAK